MTTTSALVGRAVELDQFNDLLTGIEDQGRAVLVHGDPGIGKSSLLHAVASAARARGMTVLETTGVESESGMPYAGLHRLLMPLLGGTERLPETQRRALFTAIGIEDGPAPQIFLVALAALTLLTERAEARPVVAVIDDIQWL
ncbi:MAG: ATP-binding protein, partial [Nocardioides sp.]